MIKIHASAADLSLPAEFLNILKNEYPMAILMHLLGLLAKLLKALWLFLAGVAAVVAIYYLLTGVEQGIDVVIQSGERVDSGVSSILAVFLWSFLVWYSSRTLSYIKQHKDDEIFSKKAAGDVTSAMLYEKYCIPSSFYQHIPRMLAYNCFVSMQVAIFHLPTFFAWSGAVMLLVILFHNVFYFLLHKWFSTGRSKLLTIVNPVVIAAYATFLVNVIMDAYAATGLFNDPSRHRFWLSVIALFMFILQVVAVLFFIARRRSIDRRRKNPALDQSRLLRFLGFNPAFNAAEAPYFAFLNVAAAAAIAIYFTAIFAMPFADLMGPLPLTLIALGVLTGLSNLVTLLSIRSSLNVMIVLVVLAFLFGHYRDPYAVRLLSTNDTLAFATRPDTKAYLSKWFDKRLPLIHDTTFTNFPVFIVLSDGGASRAGKWTSSVLGHLQDTSYSADPRNSFKDHVLCIAGASGGSVGNCVFYSLLKAADQREITGNEFSEHADAFFDSDFLTFTMARLLGPDIFRHLVPFNIPLDNRADALEKTMSASGDALLNDYFEKPLTELFDTTGALPILYVNTTQVDNGMPGVISNVLLPEGSQRKDVLSLVDSMSLDGYGSDMRLSTAAVISSRFPYVSPAGKVFDRYYVDGGYFDNSGAGTVLEFLQELKDYLSDTTRVVARYRDRLTFHLVHITNSEVLQPSTKAIHPLTNDLLAPLLTLAGMQGSSTNIGDGLLTNAFKQFNADTTNAMIVYSLYDETWDPTKNTGEFEEGYPMSWVLSDYQLNRMEAALQRANAGNLPKFGY